MKMKKLMVLCIIGIFAAQADVKAQYGDKAMYEEKISKYTTMRNVGIGLTAGGAVLTTTGIILMVQGLSEVVEDDPWDDEFNTEGIWKLYSGYAALSVGVIALGGGGTLWGIGAAKKSKYESRLNRISLEMSPDMRKVVSLTYRF